MMSRPTLAELRARVHKDRHREIGNWLARRVARPSAVYGTWLAVRLGLSAHQVTLAALIANVAAAVSLGLGTRAGFVAGVLLAHLAFWLDHVDGQVARWRRTASLDGVYFDYLMHHVAALCLGFGLGYGLAARTGDPRWAAAGFAIALGWTVLSLHNDCRYKAFFQRLKRDSSTYRVAGGSGGRPAPPAPWPRRGIAALTWPALKLCEPHVVLIEISCLAILAIVAPDLWLVTWRFYLRLGAIAVPLLALARSARAIARDAVEQEFSRWFQPETSEALDESAAVDAFASARVARPVVTRGSRRVRS
jgi:phosphatidylglycerophosphate synthase